MSNVFADIIGNESLRKHLAAEIRADSLSHAYLIEGESGSGKRLLATRIAMALACERRTDRSADLPCMRCNACQKILHGNSPDLIFVSKGDKATVGVDAVRTIKSDVLIAPNDFRTKIYILEDAHLMTEQAQNALLLTLEEPPPYVLFLLLCENLSPILETIRSRAPVLRTEHLSPARIRSYLLAENPEANTLLQTAPKDLDEIVVAANGSIGRALQLLDPKQRRSAFKLRENTRRFLQLCLAKRQSSAAWQYLNALPQKREELLAQIRSDLFCVRDLLLCKQTENAPLCFFYDREEACSLAYRFTVPELLRLISVLSDAADRLRQNANIRLLLTELAVQAGLFPAFSET